MNTLKFTNLRNILGQIVIAKTAAPYEKFAAEELQSYFLKMTGLEMPIEMGFEQRNGPSIYILDGSRPSHRRRLSFSALDQLKDDGYLIQTHQDSVYISSKEPFGIVYGVYQYLTRVFGVYFYDYGPEGETVPQFNNLEHGLLSIVKNPKLKYRGLQMVHCPKRLDWMAKNGFNNNRLGNEKDLAFWDKKLNEIEGEHLKRGIKINFGHHIFHLLLPRKQYMDDNPEYFQEIDGQRKTVDQFYWSFENSKEALEEACYNLKYFLKRHPSISMLDFWPTDGICDLREKDYKTITGENFYEDDSWRENIAGSSVEARFGDPHKARVYAIYTKHVADYLGRHFPDLTVTITAYGDLTQPCRKEILPKNVSPFIAMYWRCYKDNIFDEDCVYNKQYLQIIKEWTDMYPDQDIYLSEYYMGMKAYACLPYPIISTIFSEWAGLIELGINGAKVHTGNEADNAVVPYFINYLAFQAIVWEDFDSAEEFIEHYCKVFYQEANQPIFNMYMNWEKTLLTAPGDTQPSAHFFHQFFKRETVNVSFQYLREARELTIDPIVSKRIFKLEQWLHYVDLVLDLSQDLEKSNQLSKNNVNDEDLEKALLAKLEKVDCCVKKLIQSGLNIYGFPLPTKWFRKGELRKGKSFWERQIGALKKADWVKEEFNNDILQEAVKNKI